MAAAVADPALTARPGRPWWVLAGALLAGLLAWSPLGERTALPLLDGQARLAAPAASAAEVVVIDIDDASLRTLAPRLGAWPYPRDVHALALETLQAAGARAVAIDLLFTEPAAGDRALARALQRAAVPVVLAAATLPRPELGATAGAPTSLIPGAALALPQPALLQAAPTSVGLVTTPLDLDGRLRRLPAFVEADGRRLPSLPVAVWQAADAAGAPSPPLVADDQGRFVLPAPVPGRLPPVLPFTVLAEVALGERSPEALAAAVRGRVVFVGSSAMHGDAVLTPWGQASGTLVLAQAYGALRSGGLLSPPRANLDLALLALALVPAAWLTWRGRTRWRHDVLALLLALAAVAAVALGALLAGGLQSNVAPALAALLAGAALLLLARQRELVHTQRRLAYERAVAVAANRTKSEFLANVSHEIRTPLNALLGVAEALARTPLDARQQRHVEVFRHSGTALLTLINDLLDLSRIEAGRLELHTAPLDLRAELAQVVALLRPRAVERGLGLELDIDDGLPAWVHGDARRLMQAVTNLAGNAIKFTPSGRVLIDASAPQAGQIRIEVVDSGIGIAPSKLETIFEPFTQADGSITRAFGGTGLGLSITRSLVRQMGGTIGVRSQPGRGSTFTLDLPLPACPAPLPGAVQAPATAFGDAAGDAVGDTVGDTVGETIAGERGGGIAATPAVDAAESTAPAAAGAKPLEVLLAEDNEVNVYVFRALLEGVACRIDVAADGYQAIRMWQHGRYDIVFMDVQMPGLDGHTATAEIRRLEQAQGRARVPIVALSAHAFDSDRAASLAVGCDDHLTKPVARAVLLAALARARSDGAPTLLAPPAPPLPTVRAAIDHTQARARLGGNAELHERVLGHAAVFVSTWQHSCARALAERDAEQLGRLAHDLKAIAGSIGAQALSDAARDFELMLGRPPRLDPDSAAFSAADRALRDALGPVLQELAARVPNSPAAAPEGDTARRG